jgi:hypothetical protein
MQPSRIVRITVTLLVAASMAVGGVALAWGPHGSGGPGNSGLFKPGKGCGDKNHIHYRQNECKKSHGLGGGGKSHGNSGKSHGKGKGHGNKGGNGRHLGWNK